MGELSWLLAGGYVIDKHCGARAVGLLYSTAVAVIAASPDAVVEVRLMVLSVISEKPAGLILSLIARRIVAARDDPIRCSIERRETLRGERAVDDVAGHRSVAVLVVAVVLRPRRSFRRRQQPIHLIVRVSLADRRGRVDDDVLALYVAVVVRRPVAVSQSEERRVPLVVPSPISVGCSRPLNKVCSHFVLPSCKDRAAP